jgi:hypothetical protein
VTVLMNTETIAASFERVITELQKPSSASAP